MKIQFPHNYDSIISIENLLEAWKEFTNGKKSRKDVQEFQLNLMSNIISLHNDLVAKTYSHSTYEPFNISDPKPRKIHKASVRDRLLHHAICRRLYPFFDRTFIPDSYSCRLNKGTHKAINRFRSFAYKVSKNHTRTAWILKCDIRKFFDSVDQDILIKILRQYIPDKDIVWLLHKIIGSFNSGKNSKGLPLGNLTSQLLVNIYMNQFDQFIKHKLKTEYYIRYADDFVTLSQDEGWLQDTLSKIKNFLSEDLLLELHPNKISIQTTASGVDFLGWINFVDHKVLRTSTKKRILKKLKPNNNPNALASYSGLVSHGNTYGVRKQINVITGKVDLNLLD
ncbi:MAG: group II intron reverse transcriptase domain-containing protein [Candidatus Yanofskybacteria bacterium]|nr:group II intron reverse transcriptase domain-containing protein [Candidatus Yanofskybacteria bacterium]